MLRSLVGSEMCIRDRSYVMFTGTVTLAHSLASHSSNFNKSLILYHVSRHSHIGPFSALSQFQIQPVPYPMSCFQAQSHWPILCSVTVPTLTSPLSYVMFPGSVTLAHFLFCHSSNFNQYLILCHVSRHSHIGPFSAMSQFQRQSVPYPMSCFQEQSHWPILCSVAVPSLTNPLSYVMFRGTVTLAHFLFFHSSNFNQSLVLCHVLRHCHIGPFSALSQFQL